MRVLAGLALAGILAGCMPSSDALVDRPWDLAEITGALPAVPAHIEFGAEPFGSDGQFTVQPGCNTGGGTYRIVGNTIQFADVRLTAMACGDPADAQEQAFLGVLSASPRFEIETRTGRLRLTADDGALVFVTP
jgi:heat shock protein HslJ